MPIGPLQFTVTQGRSLDIARCGRGEPLTWQFASALLAALTVYNSHRTSSAAPTRLLSSVGLSARASSLRVVWSAAPPSDLAESYEVAWRSSDPDAEGPGSAGAWQDASGSDSDCAAGDDPGPADDCGEDVGSVLAYTISGLSSGSGYDVRVRSRNAAGNGPWSALHSAVVDGSGDATLSSLSLWDASPGGGVLSFSPVFSPEVLSYSASVAHSVSRVVVVPVSSASGAGISVSVGVLPRAPVSSGSRSVVGGVAAGGVLRFVLSVSSSDGSVASSYALSVSRARAPLLFDSVLSSRRVHVSGGALSLLLPGARGGLGLLSYSVSGAPSGLSFSSSDRRLSGLLSSPLSPVSPLSSVLTYSVSDSVSPVLRSSQTFTLTMSPSPSFSPPVPSVLSLRFNMSASETFPSLSGGFSPYAYSLLGEMPPGLSFDASTRVFSGVPGVSGTFLLAYHALDVLGSSEGLSSGRLSSSVSVRVAALLPSSPVGLTVRPALGRLRLRWSSPTGVSAGGEPPLGYRVRWRLKDADGLGSGSAAGAVAGCFRCFC